MTSWLSSHPLSMVGLVVWAIGLLMLMPGARGHGSRTPMRGLIVAAIGVVLLCSAVGSRQPEFADEVLFWLFGIGALVSGTLMITSRSPVYAALWFALVTLCTCGLFAIRSAPFLAAATLIVYAGAVIVTFLFVIMLAQQGGAARYDQQSRQSVVATLSAFVLLGAIVFTLQTRTPAGFAADASETAAVTASAAGNPLSMADEKHPLGSMKGLGRSLFGDYLFAVELAGTLLLVASVGAIAIAPRRAQGAL